MLDRARQLIRLRPHRGVLVVFLATIVLPGISLAFFGLRALRCLCLSLSAAGKRAHEQNQGRCEAQSEGQT